MATGRIPNAVLVGLPGCGKTVVGRRAARLAQREFLDFDEEIVRREHASVKKLFETKGEAYFRNLERSLTTEIAGRSALIVAPGGGWMAQPGLPELLGGTGRTIYLRVTPESVSRRLRRVAERPLLAGGDPLEKLRELYEQRQACYESADVIVEAETLTRDQVAAEVARIAISFERI